jgi:hypothetical protein
MASPLHYTSDSKGQEVSLLIFNLSVCSEINVLNLLK